MPDGEYDFIDYIDDDGVDPGAVKLQLKITVANDTITYDFTGTSPQRKGAINNPYASSTACIISALRFMISHDIPKNSGTWRPVKAIIPEGSVLNPKLPAAVAARGVTIGRLVDVMLGAENKIAPDKMMGCPTGVDTLLNVGGQDKTGKLFIFSETIWGGWGGRSTADGVDYNTPPYLNGGNQPVESNEELYPIIYRQHGYAEDTEGAGKYRGSLGLVREIEFVGDEPAAMQLRVDRRQFPPFGIHGGQSGTPTRATINPDTENRDVGKSTITLNKGDVFRVVVAGAGGYGNPFERSVDMVLDDVLKEKISTRRAREAYGVAIDENSMKVDEGETQRLRETLANDRNKS
jgi:N-methylhydantoinase B